MKVTPKLYTVASIMVATQLVWATCYVSPSYQCRTNVPPIYPECHEIYYSIEKGNYCDSRDGQCGATICEQWWITVTRTDYFYFAYQGSCTSEPWSTFGPVEDGNCTLAALSGPRCGYCGGSY